MPEDDFHRPGKPGSPGIRHLAAGIDGMGILAIPDQVLDGNAATSQKFRQTSGVSRTASGLGYMFETIEEIIEDEIIRSRQPGQCCLHGLTDEEDGLVASLFQMEKLAADCKQLGLDIDDIDRRIGMIDNVTFG